MSLNSHAIPTSGGLRLTWFIKLAGGGKPVSRHMEGKAELLTALNG